MTQSDRPALLNEELCRMLDALSGRNLQVAMRYIVARLAFLGVEIPSTRQRVTSAQAVQKLTREDKVIGVLEQRGPIGATRVGQYTNMRTAEARAVLEQLAQAGVIGVETRPAKRGAGTGVTYSSYEVLFARAR